MSRAAYKDHDSEFGGPIRKTNESRLCRIATILTYLGLLAAVYLMFFAPYMEEGTTEARRHQCDWNLRMIALALCQYETQYGAFPPAYTTDQAGRPLHSWRTLILPYLDHQELYGRIDLSKPWNDPANAKALEPMPSAFHCPSSMGQRNSTTYLANAAERGFLLPGRPRHRDEILDGLASTLAVIEIDQEHAVPWMAPVDADQSLILNLSPASKLGHPGFVNAVFVDSSVRTLDIALPADRRRAMISISGFDGPDDNPQGR